MKILGIETATSICSVAIVGDDGFTIERHVNSKRMHSEKIIFLIDECIKESMSEWHSINGVAVSIGPGSFTGLRIGLSVGKGLAFSTGIPLVGVPTLSALAYQLVTKEKNISECLILPMIDARRDEVYCALFQWKNGEILELQPPDAKPLDQILSLEIAGNTVFIIGDGAEKFKEYCKKTAFDKSYSYIFPEGEVSNCNAIYVARMGLKKISAGICDDLSSIEPLYVKEFFTTGKK